MSNVLRKIAEHELDQCFHDLPPVIRDELATSLVRQWIGSAGNALIITAEFHYWFRIEKLEDGGTRVVRRREPQTFVDHMRRYRVIEAEVPSLLHALSVRQSVECVTDCGEKIRFSVDPAKPAFAIEFGVDGKKWRRHPNG